MTVIGRRTTASRCTLTHGIIQVPRLEFRCLTCGAHLHTDEDDVLTHGYIDERNPHVLTFCACNPNLLVPVTMIGSQP